MLGSCSYIPIIFHTLRLSFRFIFWIRAKAFLFHIFTLFGYWKRRSSDFNFASIVFWKQKTYISIHKCNIVILKNYSKLFHFWYSDCNTELSPFCGLCQYQILSSWNWIYSVSLVPTSGLTFWEFKESSLLLSKQINSPWFRSEFSLFPETGFKMNNIINVQPI